MIGRIIAIGAAFLLAMAVTAQADDVGGEDIVVPMVVEETMEEPVTAAPPPFVTIEGKTIAAGLGISWGKGTLLFEGERYGFSLNGVSLVDLGISSLSGEGFVKNLDNIEDFAGSYVALEAGAAAGVGVSTLTMRNEKGVVITLKSELEGFQLTLGTEGFRIALD